MWGQVDGGGGYQDGSISAYNQVPFCSCCAVGNVYFILLYTILCKKPTFLRHRQLDMGRSDGGGGEGVNMYKNG